MHVAIRLLLRKVQVVWKLLVLVFVTTYLGSLAEMPLLVFLIIFSFAVIPQILRGDVFRIIVPIMFLE